MQLIFAGDPLSIPDLTLLVAQKVMGLAPIERSLASLGSSYEHADGDMRLFPHFASSMGDAWTIVERLTAEGYELALAYIEGEWHAEFEPARDDLRPALGIHACAPLSLCIAALGVRGIYVEDQA